MVTVDLTELELKVVSRALLCYRPPEPETDARTDAMLKLASALLRAEREPMSEELAGDEGV